MSPMGSDDSAPGSMANPYNNAGGLRPPKGDPYAKAASNAASRSGRKPGGGGKAQGGNKAGSKRRG